MFDFVPTTFVLPNEYLAFMKAFADRQESDEDGEKFWICKPSGAEESARARERASKRERERERERERQRQR